MAITTILWDVDNTLLDFSYSLNCAITKCFQKYGLYIDDSVIKRYTEINDYFWKRLELQEITRAELVTGRFAQLFREYNIKDIDVTVFHRNYEDELGSVYRYMEQSISIFCELKQKYRQYLVTNGTSVVQRKKLELSGFLSLADGIFISEELGVDKPSKEYFDICLSQIEEKDRRKILLVGDSLTSDIKGGITAGVPTCWYRPEGTANTSEYRPEYEISHLQELTKVLEEIS